MNNMYLIPVDFPEDIDSKESADEKFNEFLEDIHKFKNRLRELVFCTEFDKICPKGENVIDWLEEEVDNLIGDDGMLLGVHTALCNLAKLTANWDQLKGIKDIFDKTEQQIINEDNEIPVIKPLVDKDLSLN